jgi:hypothetical protein
MTLNSGQGVNACTADYSQAATGSGRSVFNGAFILNTNNTQSNNASNTAITSSLAGTRGSSIALTTDASSEQEMQGGVLSVSGAGTTTVPTQGSVVLNSVTCITNGITGAC